MSDNNLLYLAGAALFGWLYVNNKKPGKVKEASAASQGSGSGGREEIDLGHNTVPLDVPAPKVVPVVDIKQCGPSLPGRDEAAQALKPASSGSLQSEASDVKHAVSDDMEVSRNFPKGVTVPVLTNKAPFPNDIQSHGLPVAIKHGPISDPVPTVALPTNS